MLVTNDKKIADKARKLSVFGMTTAWEREKSESFFVPEFVKLGYNYKMSDILAAVGIIQLKRLKYIIKRKCDLAKYWNEKLQDIEVIEPPFIAKDVRHIYQSYVALVDKRINRNKLIDVLKKKGIQTQIGTYASHIQPVYNSKEKCPNSLDIFKRSLALPMYYSLKEEEIDIAAKNLKKALEELK